MKEKFMILLNDPTREKLTIFHEYLWANELNRIPDDKLYNNEEIDIQIDFDAIEKIAIKPTPFEYIFLKIEASKKTFFVFLFAITIILIPVSIYFLNYWAINFLYDSSISEKLFLLISLISLVFLSILSMIIIFNKIFKANFKDKKPLRPQLNNIYAIICVSIVILFSWYFSDSTNKNSIANMKEKYELINDMLAFEIGIKDKTISVIKLKNGDVRYIPAKFQNYLEKIEQLQNANSDKIEGISEDLGFDISKASQEDKAALYNTLAIGLERRGEKKEALKAYERALKRDRINVITLQNLEGFSKTQLEQNQHNPKIGA